MALFPAMAESALTSERALSPPSVEPGPAVQRAKATGAAWIYAYVVVQLACQLCLLIQELQLFRVFVRSAAFGTSLLFLVIAPRQVQRGGMVRVLALVALTILTLEMFNPLGGNPLSVVAHWTLCIAVIAPLSWVGRLRIPEGTLARLLMMLWGFHAFGALLGVLQVYFPGHFQPDFTALQAQGHLLIQLSSGDWVPRPTGLSDTPGGAGADGLYAALFGVGVMIARPFRGARALAALSVGLGLMCIYLSEVRAALVTAFVCFIVLTVLFAWSGRASRATVSALLIGTIASIGFYFALGVGGRMMMARVHSLVAADPGTVYYNTRGAMLEQAIMDFLPRYPLGAGLGHWGMINAYFGSAAQEIGSEIQVGGWILDGGLPLLLVYPAAVIAAILYACRASRVPDARNATWAIVVAAYGVGALALCFEFPIFMGTPGLEFWLANAVLMQEIRLPRLKL